MLEFFNGLASGSVGFEELGSAFSEMFSAIAASPTVMYVWEKLMSFTIAPTYPYIMVLLGLGIAFFGKKMLPVLKFVAFFVIGFLIGSTFLAPMLDKFVVMPYWIMGLALAIVTGVFNRLEYVISYILTFGVGGYVGVYALTALMSGGEGREEVAAVAAILAVFVALMLRKKFFEHAITAFLGSLWTCLAFINVLDYTLIPIFTQHTMFWIGVALIAVLGYFVQFKTRRRYY
ncbi:MAG: hypothetical protein IJY65_03990 [Clostridia bacterium]|nr:hypothetical protein [Clostridia bacterium]